MFQELEKVGAPFYNPPPAPELKIKPFDNLYISILTLDPEVNKILNPNLMGNSYFSGTSQLFGEPTSRYINGYRIAADSTVLLPMLGKINVVGLSLSEARDRIENRAIEFLKEPEIQVKFLNFRVNVSGEIKVPGIYYNYEGTLNILDAISLANGITDFADLRNVVIKRYEDNRIYTFNVDLTNNEIFKSEVFYMRPNDIIYIPPGSLKRRSANSDTYSRLLSTISTLLVAAALFLK